jgi:hypothetical protein
MRERREVSKMSLRSRLPTRITLGNTAFLKREGLYRLIVIRDSGGDRILDQIDKILIRSTIQPFAANQAERGYEPGGALKL